MKLTSLYQQFIQEGYCHFYIEGVGGPQTDDVHSLGFDDGLWKVCYTERGQKSEPIFSSPHQEEAIRFYADFISKIEHWHLVVFTRSAEICHDYFQKLQSFCVRQNDIPNFSQAGDRVYRLFVVNKNIYLAKAQFQELPYFDSDFKRYAKN